MQVDILLRIKNDPMLYHYLKHHSYWYKILRRNSSLLKEMTQEMKKEYKMTATDKLGELGSKIMLMRTFLDMLQ